MRVVLIIAGCVELLGAVFMWLVAKSAIHEINGSVLFAAGFVTLGIAELVRIAKVHEQHIDKSR